MPKQAAYRWFAFASAALIAAFLISIGSRAALQHLREKEQRHIVSIFSNLRLIEGAKDQWAMEKKKTTGDTPTTNEVAEYLIYSRLPAPIIGERYKMNSYGQPAEAVLPVMLGTYKAGESIVAP